jgi:hypothetical protein
MLLVRIIVVSLHDLKETLKYVARLGYSARSLRCAVNVCTERVVFYIEKDTRMGFIWFVTNALGWSFPALLPIVTAVAGALGYVEIPRLPQRSRLRGKLNRWLAGQRMVHASLEHSEVVGERLRRDQELFFKKDDLLIVFRRDERGRFGIRVIGPTTRTAMELKELGQEFARIIIRKYTVQRITEELERRGLSIASVSTTESGEQEIIARKW